MKNFYINPDKIKNYISIERCKDSFLYIIQARNSNLGIFNKKDNSFTISRLKFSSNFLFDEFHWDTGEPYGTVKPLKQLELTFKMNDDEKLKFLNKRVNELQEEIEQIFSKKENTL